ncbi:MAG: ABC transporter ATP-binding protein [Chloroflexota bacterium]
MKSLVRAVKYLKKYQWTALGAIFSLLMVTATNLISPQLLRWIIDSGIEAQSATIVWWGTGFLVVVALLRGLFNFSQSYLSEKASQSVAFDLRNDLFSKIQGLSFSYHDQAQTGQLMTRATSDVELVRQFTGTGLFQLLNALMMILGSATILLVMNWQLALIVLATVPVMLIFLFRFFSKIQPMFKIIQQRLGFLNTILQENLAGVRVVKAFAREPFEANRFMAANVHYKEQNIAALKIFVQSLPVFFFISNIGVVLIVWVGGLWVIDSRLSLGDLVAFITYLNFLVMPLMLIGFLSGMMARASASAKRIFEVLDAESEVNERPDATPLPPLQGQVQFDSVSFRYIGQEQDVLKSISFSVEPGQTVAILGATGSGKSTIINLLPRFYDVTQGCILVDGVDIREATLDSLRSQIGIVLQETTLFSGTIRDNIAYGRPDARDDEVIAATKAAQAHDFILEQPQGYQTIVGERGVGLSGGQKQRVAIARALLVNPKVLVMDDSTSAVDAETEFQIQQALDQLMKGRTSFVIAQRISTVRNADQIIVLDRGRIADLGTHEQLQRDSELYAEIVQSQLKEDSTAKQELAMAEIG